MTTKENNGYVILRDLDGEICTLECLDGEIRDGRVLIIIWHLAI